MPIRRRGVPVIRDWVERQTPSRGGSSRPVLTSSVHKLEMEA